MPWSDATLVTRAFPGAYFVFIAVFYTWRILLLGRRAGASPVHKGERGSAGRRHHVRFVAMRAAILVVMLARAAFPAVDRWLVPLGPLWHTPVMLGGDALLLLSFLGVLLLHFGLGAEWRSGIAPEGPARLRTGGPYARVRHPSFSLVMLGQLGLFLAVPSLFTLACLALGARTLVEQARLEEEQLARRFPAAFAAYAARVPAWPWRREV